MRELWLAIALFIALLVVVLVSPVRAERPLGATREPFMTLERGRVRLYMVPIGAFEKCLAVADGPMGGLILGECG